MASTINADVTNGLVLTPDTSGEIKLQAGGADIATVTSSGITMASGKTIAGNVGKVLQVVQASTTTPMTTTSTTPADTNLTASITPSSTSSKILIIVSQSWYLFCYTYYMGVCLNLLRDSTAIQTLGGTANATIQGIGNLQLNGLGEIHLGGTACLSYLDSPSTTSSVTYKTQGYVNSTGSSRTGIFQRDNVPSTITLLEIAG